MKTDRRPAIGLQLDTFKRLSVAQAFLTIQKMLFLDMINNVHTVFIWASCDIWVSNCYVSFSREGLQ